MKVALSISINMFIFGAIVVWICSSKLIQIDYVSTEVVIYLTSLITIGSLFIIASLVCGVIISLAYRKE